MSGRIVDPNSASIVEAAVILRAGGLVGMPTETVYGLAADATNGMAVARIYEAKGRPSFNPLICHVADLGMAEELADFSPTALTLARAFWPGPLTLVLPRRADCAVSELATAGLATIGVRCPAHPAALALIETTGRPLAAPSANPSEAISPTCAHDVADGLGAKIGLILDGGRCRSGIESTIVRVDRSGRCVILRPGALAREEIEAVVGAVDSGPVDGPVEAPGMSRRHYAPKAALRLNAAAPLSHEAWLGFGLSETKSDFTLNLSPTGDLVEAAANLFAMLRRLDAQARAIAVASIPEHGLGEAINDRLRRAASL